MVSAKIANRIAFMISKVKIIIISTVAIRLLFIRVVKYTTTVAARNSAVAVIFVVVEAQITVDVVAVVDFTSLPAVR